MGSAHANHWPMTAFPDGDRGEQSNEFLCPGGLIFDADLGIGGIQYSTIPVEETLPKANDELAIYGYSAISKADLLADPQYIASEVGDDEAVISNNKAFVAMISVMTDYLGMKKSRHDTSINSRYGNFCEELLIKPDNYYQTYVNTRNTGDTKNMSFLDVPKIRLGIDIRPMRMEHSSTNDGKCGMEGSRLAWLNNDCSMKLIHEVFNIFQDVNLGVIRDKKPAYLPTELGGYGKPIPFSEPSNLERFLRSYKSGAHADLIRAIVRRANRFLDARSRGGYPKKDPLLNHVSRFQASFHDWVKGKDIHAPTTWIDIPENLVQYRAGRLGESPVKDDVIGRLTSEGRLVTESKLSVVVEHNRLCQALAGSVNMVDFQKVRQEAIKKWRGLSVFGQESYGLIERIDIDPIDYRLLKEHEVRAFMSNVFERRHILRMVFRSEDVYRSEAIDAVYKEGPMMVPFKLTPRNKIHGMQFVEQRTFRNEVIDTEDIGAEDELLEWILQGKDDPPPRRLINDDNALIVEAAAIGRPIALITDDKRLCIQMNRKTGLPVFRVPVEWYYRDMYFGDMDQPWLKFLLKRTFQEWTELQDSGSIQSGEELYFNDGMMMKHPIYSPFNWLKGMGSKDPIIKTEVTDFGGPPDVSPDSLLFNREKRRMGKPINS